MAKKHSTLSNEEFLDILKKACESEDMDKYLNETLSGYFPYNLTFGKGGDEWMVNLKEEKLRVLTNQKAQLLKARDNYPKNSNDYRTISAVIDEHNKEIRKILGD